MERRIPARRRPTRLSLLALGGSLYILSAAASAQTAAESSASDKLDEVVVTAQKRKERIQDVPISIDAVGAEQLIDQQVHTIADLNRISPSLEIQQAANENPGGGGQIRGIGTQSFANGAVASVGIVVDQVSQGNTNINNLFDIAQVEVLKGPQGTLFGLTTSAGVINITTNAPDPTAYAGSFHTDLSTAGVAGSDYGNQIVQSAVNIPLTPDSAIRVAAFGNMLQGPDYNEVSERYVQSTDYGGRLRYLWKPSDDLSVNLIGDYAHEATDGDNFFTVIKTAPGSIDAGILAACGIVAEPGNRDYCSSFPNHGGYQNFGASAQVDYTILGQTLTSITAFRHVDDTPHIYDIFRLSAEPTQISYDGQGGGSHQVSQEVRLASPNGVPLEYTVGAFYARQKLTQDGAGLDVTVSPFPGVTIPISVNSGTDIQTYIEQWAAFGQATYHLTDTFSLLAGLRLTRNELSDRQIDKNDPALVETGGDRENNVSFKVGAQYEISPSTMAYVTVARGYKGPQVNISDITVPATLVRAEIPMDYEGGIKSTTLDGRLGIDLNLFYESVHDFQGQICVPSSSGLSCGPDNLSRVISKGVDLELTAKPLHGLKLTGGFIYDPATYPAGYQGSDGTSLAGEQLSFAPKYKVTLSADYTHPLSSGFELVGTFDSVYKSDLDLDNANDPNLHYPAHWILNGSIGIQSTEAAWRLSMFARNLTNEHEPAVIFPNFPNTGSYAAYYTPQSFRSVGVSLDYQF